MKQSLQVSKCPSCVMNDVISSKRVHSLDGSGKL